MVSIANHSNEDRSRSSLDKLIQQKDITWKKIIQISSDMPSDKKITELNQLRELKNILEDLIQQESKLPKQKYNELEENVSEDEDDEEMGNTLLPHQNDNIGKFYHILN